MKNFIFVLVFLLGSLSLASCSSSDEEKRIEYVSIVEQRSSVDLMNDLWVAADGDVEALARILQITPSSIERIRKGETVPTDVFEEKLRDVAVYYYVHDKSFKALRSALDGEYSWYDTMLYSFSLHPWWFWGANIVLGIIVSICLGEGQEETAGYLFLAELVVFIIAWICSLIFSPDAMQDRYKDSINPVIEQIR